MMLESFFSDWRKVIGLSVVLALCATLFVMPTLFTSEPTLNQYESAQKQTVLIHASGVQGSGVVIRRTNAEGRSRWFVWTAAHVVVGSTQINIVVYHRCEGHKAGRTTYKARLLGYNTKGDFALLQVLAPSDAFIPAEFATELPRVGDPIFVVGNMFGENFDGAVSAGVIAQLGIHPDGIPGWPWAKNLDQTTAPIYPGNSGGPVFNARNQVLGLIVGGMASTLNGYVPVRVIEPWAATHHLLWALRGKWCPSDARLDKFFRESHLTEPVI